MFEEKSHVGMSSCYFCGEADRVILDRRLRKSLPRNVGVLDMDPCNKCREFMKQGIILISIKDDTTEEEMGKGGKMPNPYRTGGWCVIRREAFEKMVNDDKMMKWGLKTGFMFITDIAWDAIGLPRPEKEDDLTPENH